MERCGKSCKPSLASLNPSQEEVEIYLEELKGYPKQPYICKVSSIGLPDGMKVDKLWDKAVAFSKVQDTPPLPVFLLLLQTHNTNPQGIVVLYVGEGYDCAEGSSRRLIDKHYQVAALGENLTTKTEVFEEFYRVLSQPEADVKKGNIFSESELKSTAWDGLYRFTPYFAPGISSFILLKRNTKNT